VDALDQFKEDAVKVINDYDEVCQELMAQNRELTKQLQRFSFTVKSVQQQLATLGVEDD